VLLASVLALLAFLERKAWLCGLGPLQARVAPELRGDWINGQFRVVDADGFGVVTPGAYCDLNDGSRIGVDEIRGYRREPKLEVEVAAGSDETVRLTIEGTGLGREIRRAATRRGPEPAGWVSTEPRACFYGVFWGIRAVLIVAALAPLLAIV